MDKPPRLEVTYVVSRWDVVSMYLGSWAARMVAAPGVAIVLLAILSLPSGRISLTEKIQVLGFGLALAVLAPVGLVLVLMSIYGIPRLIGKKVHLVIDEAGVQGWPLAPYQDRSWPRIRKVRRLRGGSPCRFASSERGPVGCLSLSARLQLSSSPHSGLC